MVSLWGQNPVAVPPANIPIKLAEGLTNSAGLISFDPVEAYPVMFFIIMKKEIGLEPTTVPAKLNSGVSYYYKTTDEFRYGITPEEMRRREIKDMLPGLVAGAAVLIIITLSIIFRK